MARVGRKLKVTDATIRDITDALGVGATIEIACAYAGVAMASYYNWQEKGLKALTKLQDDPEVELTASEIQYIKFVDAIEKANAYAAIGWLNVVNEAAQVDASRAQWLLKVRYPQGYSGIERHEVTGGAGGPIDINAMMDDVMDKVMLDDEDNDG